MHVAPKPGFKYRDTVTRQLVPETGFDADPNDLDIARALACGDLVEVAPDAPPAPVNKRAAAAAEPQE